MEDKTMQGLPPLLYKTTVWHTEDYGGSCMCRSNSPSKEPLDPCIALQASWAWMLTRMLLPQYLPNIGGMSPRSCTLCNLGRDCWWGRKLVWTDPTVTRITALSGYSSCQITALTKRGWAPRPAHDCGLPANKRQYDSSRFSNNTKPRQEEEAAASKKQRIPKSQQWISQRHRT